MANPTNSFHSLNEFVTGTVLLIDKPFSWTSFDALNRIKAFVRNNVVIPKNQEGHDQRFKIGHAGTLDPLATGLLVVCTGRYTKKIDEFQAGEKEYTGTVFIGKTTPSYDLETEPEGDYNTGHITHEMILATAKKFIGDQWQKPPQYSAKQVDGQRAYKAARKGEGVIIPAVPVSIADFEITRIQMPEVDFRIKCTKGTYIRTIAHDFGQKMESGSYLKSLRRTIAEPFDVEDALTVDQLLEKLQKMAESEREKPLP
jgi:tRNA pseudouridine55 synthase